MSYDPISGKLPNIDPVKISTAIINSPVGRFTAHTTHLAMVVQRLIFRTTEQAIMTSLIFGK